MDILNSSLLTFNNQFVNRYLSQTQSGSLQLPTITNAQVTFQPMSINLFNTFDLQAELQQAVLSNLITITQDRVFESFQNLQKIPFSQLFDNIAKPVLAFLYLDDINQSSYKSNSMHTENINQLFNPNINYTWLKQTTPNASYNSKQQFLNKIKPQDYQKKKKQNAKSGTNLLGRLFTKLLKKIAKF